MMPGCERCSIDWNYDNLDEWNNGTLGEVRIGKGEMMCDIGPSWHITPIKFCPFCGRRLEHSQKIFKKQKGPCGQWDGRKDKVGMWITAAIGSLIGTAIVSLFICDGIALFAMKWALSTVLCRAVLGIMEKSHRKQAED